MKPTEIIHQTSAKSKVKLRKRETAILSNQLFRFNFVSSSLNKRNKPQKQQPLKTFANA